MKTGGLVIAWPTSSTLSAHFTEGIVATVLDDRIRRRLVKAYGWLSGPLVAAARTGIVEDFLASPAEWLLQLDSDMVFTPDDIVALLDAASADTVPIIGGLYAGTGQLVNQVDAEAGWFTTRGVRFLDSRGATGVIAVDFVGAGALLVHRTVYERMAKDHPAPQPWFQEVAEHGRVDGEDWTFCARAARSGFPVHVHAGARFGHSKMLTVVARK